MLAEGIFYSKLMYCLPLYGNVFNLSEYKDGGSRYINYTLSDNNKLQVLQNKLNRILTRSGLMTSTVDLLRKSESLSIQQMIAYQTIILTFKIIHTSKPKYLSDKLEFDERNYLLRDGSNKLKKVNYKLNQSREGFIYRAITLFNMLDQKLRQETNLRVFKSEARIWVEKDVRVKPKT